MWMTLRMLIMVSMVCSPFLLMEGGLVFGFCVPETNPFDYLPKNWLTGVMVALHRLKPGVRNFSTASQSSASTM